MSKNRSLDSRRYNIPIEGTTGTGGHNDMQNQEESHSSRSYKALIGAGLLLLLGIIAAIWWRQAPVTASARVVFLQADEDNILQLQVFTLQDLQPRPLTTAPADLQSFAVGPQNAQIAYTFDNLSGDTEIWLLDWQRERDGNQRLIHHCPDARCSGLVWHPDGRRLIFEQRATEAPLRPQLFWLDSVTGVTRTVSADDTGFSKAASISADGNWLTFASLPEGQMVLYHLEQQTLTSLPMQLPAAAVWHPPNDQFLFSELDLLVYHGDDNAEHATHSHDFDESIRIFATSPEVATPVPLSLAGNVDDGNAAWSPDGEWIAFGRRVVRTNTGRQLWLISADGGEERPLTAETLIHHGPPHWSADGRFLLFQRFDTSQPQIPPSIWLLEIATGELRLLQEEGYLPAWLQP